MTEPSTHAAASILLSFRQASREIARSTDISMAGFDGSAALLDESPLSVVVVQTRINPLLSPVAVSGSMPVGDKASLKLEMFR